MTKKWFNKFRTNSEFRRNIIIGLVIFFFLSNYMGSSVETQAIWPPQKTCSKYNTLEEYSGGPRFMPDDSIIRNQCKDDSCSIEIWGGLSLITRRKCVAGVPDDHYTADGSNACISGKAYKLEEWDEKVSYCGEIVGDCYKCVVAAVGESTACKSWQKGLADFADSIEWVRENIDSCSAKAYLTIGAIIFIGLAVI